MGPVEKLLREAGQLITPEGAWCRGTYAEDANGLATDYSGHNAVAFCAAGAVQRLLSKHSFGYSTTCYALLNGAAHRLGAHSAVFANDHLGLGRELLDEAIEAASELGL